MLGLDHEVILQPFNVDPDFSSPLAVLGKVVTMDGGILDDGVVYCRHGLIEAVQRRMDPPPQGFENCVRLDTQGVIYPGLIDLHNHLNYNVLPLWNPPQQFGDRYEWRAAAAYKRDISQPMAAIVAKGLSAAVVRYVEAKLLVGGTTSSQGMNLKPGGTQFYRGMVRNLEQTDDARLPEIKSQLEDLFKLDDQDKATMRQRLDSGIRLFHHLAEGRNLRAHKAYEDSVTFGLPRSNYVGIHATGLTGTDYDGFAKTGAKAVWSPTSNSLLYGETVEIARFLGSGILWGLGCDWSPSGTKNPLGEMKVALLAAEAAGVSLSHQVIAEAATVRAAAIVGWEQSLGKIAPGYYADLLVLHSRAADEYENLVMGTEKGISLVVIAGVPRYGDEALMHQTGIAASKLERRTIAGRPRALFFEHPEAPPQMNNLSLDTAITSLEEGMGDLTAPPPPMPMFRALGFEEDRLELELDMDLPSEAGFVEPLDAHPLAPLASVPLDKLTVADDPDFFTRLEAVTHAPAFLRNLRGFY